MPERQNRSGPSASEQERRENILRDIAMRVEHDGAHSAQPHPSRARQFMPFAALKGYHELAREREQVREPKRTMTDELSAELSKAISHLVKGSMASVVHYEDDRYVTTRGVVTEVDETFRFLSIVKKKIPFDDIFSIENETKHHAIINRSENEGIQNPLKLESEN